MSMTHSPRAMRGMTLIELGVVLLILVALAGMTLPMVTGVISNSGCELTDATLQNVRSAIIGSPTSPGFVGDMNRMPYNLEELTKCPTYGNFACVPPATSSYNPSSQTGWRGPYVTNSNPIPSTTFNVITDQFKSPINYPTLSGSPIQLVLAYDGTSKCRYFLLSNGPNGKPDISPLSTLTSMSSPASTCTNTNGNISSATMGYLATITPINNLSTTPPITGLGNTPQYLDISAVGSNGNRVDDRLLFIESLDPGSNTPCNQ